MAFDIVIWLDLKSWVSSRGVGANAFPNIQDFRGADHQITIGLCFIWSDMNDFPTPCHYVHGHFVIRNDETADSVYSSTTVLII